MQGELQPKLFSISRLTFCSTLPNPFSNTSCIRMPSLPITSSCRMLFGQGFPKDLRPLFKQIHGRSIGIQNHCRPCPSSNSMITMASLVFLKMNSNFSFSSTMESRRLNWPEISMEMPPITRGSPVVTLLHNAPPVIKPLPLSRRILYPVFYFIEIIFSVVEPLQDHPVAFHILRMDILVNTLGSIPLRPGHKSQKSSSFLHSSGSSCLYDPSATS